MIILALGLKLNPTNIPSVLVNKPTPYFSIPSLETEDKKLTNEMFIGEVNILNIFSSWCIPCLIEHPQMEKLSEYYKISVYGINYKDKKEDCKKWLKKNVLSIIATPDFYFYCIFELFRESSKFSSLKPHAIDTSINVLFYFETFSGIPKNRWFLMWSGS